MELTDYLQPVWVNGLITLGVCLLGGGFVCGAVALGIKRGFKDYDKKEHEDEWV